MEITKRVNTHLTELYCDKCGGKIVRDPFVMLTTYPPQYKHVCDNCGTVITTSKSYPIISYEEVEE